MTDIHGLAIERLMPHRGPMCWLHRLLDADEASVRVEAVVTGDHPLAGAAGVPAWAGLEYMAQAISVWAGTRALARGDAVKPGFLLGTRRYACRDPYFLPGSTLWIEARCELFGDNGLGVFACRILLDGEEVASANVSVYEPPEPERFLERTGA